MKSTMLRLVRTLRAVALLASLSTASAFATQIDVHGPIGSTTFGYSVAVLPNGNFVVLDPSGPTSGIGAVYLYTSTGKLISTLTGSSTDDQVGLDGIRVLANGNFVVMSHQWHNGIGAVTWVNGKTGLNGVVTVSNSLVGSSTADNIGYDAFPLTNGNYVVGSPQWNNGAATHAGAATWCKGDGTTVGPITVGNSLVGNTTEDRVGDFQRIKALPNGNYVVTSPFWDDASRTDAGAVTWGDGDAGVSGTISSGNSLVGGTDFDQIGYYALVLPSGNYVVASEFFDDGATIDAGAVTWLDGTIPATGTVSSANSLVGLTQNDRIASGGIALLANGNYVVSSPTWSNGMTILAGAVTWVDGTAPISGVVSAANSLIGTHQFDQVGAYGVTPLTNGNYVVNNGSWSSDSTLAVGAATWRSGTTNASGVVSSANSLVGTHADDNVGIYVSALANGNYVVANSNWDNGSVQNVGAVTWGDGSAGISGPVSTSNSLVGASADDHVGYVTALTNGNYVVSTPDWDNTATATADVGAQTWCNGGAACAGIVGTANSLVGTHAGDAGDIGLALTNGNYVGTFGSWDNGGTTNVGAITWMNGATGLVGVVGPSNSLIGSLTKDRIGDGNNRVVGDGWYVLLHPNWNNDVGALSFLRGDAPVVGQLNSSNSIIPAVAEGSMPFAYNPVGQRLVVGRPNEQMVTIFTPDEIFLGDFD